MNDFIKTILTFATAWLLIIGSLVMIDIIIKSLADPQQAAIPDSVLSMVLGGLLPILTLAGQFVFQSESVRSTARALNTAATDAARTALTTPPTRTIVSPGPPVEVITTTGGEPKSPLTSLTPAEKAELEKETTP